MKKHQEVGRMADAQFKRKYIQDRDISWLRFNERVLEEAGDESVPLLERLRFVSIFSENLDEFFMVRVSALIKKTEKEEDGGVAGHALDVLCREVRRLTKKRGGILRDIEAKLDEYGLREMSIGELEEERGYAKAYYFKRIRPRLTISALDEAEPQNGMTCIAVQTENGEIKLITLPRDMDEVVILPNGGYLRVDEMVRAHAGELFAKNAAEAFCLRFTKNADSAEYAQSGDIRREVRRVLAGRGRRTVRLEHWGEEQSGLICRIARSMGVREECVFAERAALSTRTAEKLGESLPRSMREALSYEKAPAAGSAGIDVRRDIFRQICSRDRLLIYPYESMESFLTLMRQAVSDGAVTGIFITVYRLAHASRLVRYLCAAAENGKRVTVIIELRARFDERRNIEWAERLKRAGCTVIFGGKAKVHAKLCLITRRMRRDVCVISTGNFNEDTAEAYTDIALFTADRDICADARRFFDGVTGGQTFAGFKRLIVSPQFMRESLCRLIDEQISRGKDGYILFKLNALGDKEMMRKLCEASRAGVRVELIVRGICRLLPGVTGRTENIAVTSVVGRFLEHSRVYVFGKGEGEKMYISSADIMKRNLSRRVETACPMTDKRAREKIRGMLALMLADNVKARLMLPDGRLVRKGCAQPPIDAQRVLLEKYRAGEEKRRRR